jgi:hypothetical protein
MNVPEPVQLVDVRQRLYVVVDITHSVLHPNLLKSGSLNSRFENVDHLFSLFLP